MYEAVNVQRGRRSIFVKIEIFHEKPQFVLRLEYGEQNIL